MDHIERNRAAAERRRQEREEEERQERHELRERNARNRPAFNERIRGAGSPRQTTVVPQPEAHRKVNDAIREWWRSTYHHGERAEEPEE